jgi:hypothetical protein
MVILLWGAQAPLQFHTLIVSPADGMSTLVVRYLREVGEWGARVALTPDARFSMMRRQSVTDERRSGTWLDKDVETSWRNG